MEPEGLGLEVPIQGPPALSHDGKMSLLAEDRWT
jgi:hypothetical protein